MTEARDPLATAPTMGKAPLREAEALREWLAWAGGRLSGVPEPSIVDRIIAAASAAELPTARDADAALTALPDRIVVGANGAYWREYPGSHYSMPPVSTDNDIIEIVAVYSRVNAGVVHDGVLRAAAERLSEAIAQKSAVEGLYASGIRDDWRERMAVDDEFLSALMAMRTALDGKPRP